MDINDRIDNVNSHEKHVSKEKKELRRDYKEQKDHLKAEYKENKQNIKNLKELSMTNVKGRIKNNLSGFLRFVVIGMLILVQVLFILFLPTLLSKYWGLFYIVLEIFSFFVAVGLTNASKNTSYKVSWLTIALLFPISGHIMYYLWGRKSTRRRLIRNTIDKFRETYAYYTEREGIGEKLNSFEPRVKRISKYISNEHMPLFDNNKMKYYSMGDYVIKDMFEDMTKAKKYIFLNFFIVAEGALWDICHEILLNKVKEGVEVVFIYDDFGAMLRTDKKFGQRLNAEGIKTIVFNPIKRYTDRLIMNYRTHQKIVVIDGEVGYTGGFNIADEYANLIERFGVWKDCGIRIEGEGVWGLAMTFMQMWSISCPDELIDFDKYRPDREFKLNDEFCHVLADGPVKSDDNVIESVYKQIITNADEFVYIMTPYLILDEYMIGAITEALKRGVDVRLITPNIPDKKIVKMLTNYNYGALLKHGAKIYEYTPGFIHSKVILSESSAIVGTVNMDYRSFYLHYENALWICNTDAMTQINYDFEKTFEISHEYTLKEWENRPFIYKFMQPALNMFSTLV